MNILLANPTVAFHDVAFPSCLPALFGGCHLGSSDGRTALISSRILLFPPPLL